MGPTPTGRPPGGPPVRLALAGWPSSTIRGPRGGPPVRLAVAGGSFRSSSSSEELSSEKICSIVLKINVRN